MRGSAQPVSGKPEMGCAPRAWQGDVPSPVHPLRVGNSERPA